MTNFEKFLQNLTLDTFLNIMLNNCDSCPNYPCSVSEDSESSYMFNSCYFNLKDWCLTETGE